MSLQLREVIDLMDGLAPPHLAFDHDNVGLQIGDPLAEVRNIITVLDMDVAVLDEALSRDANVIISHHPLIFHPLKAINTGSPEGALIETIIHNNVNVFVAHTNLDVAPRGKFIAGGAFRVAGHFRSESNRIRSSSEIGGFCSRGVRGRSPGSDHGCRGRVDRKLQPLYISAGGKRHFHATGRQPAFQRRGG